MVSLKSKININIYNFFYLILGGWGWEGLSKFIYIYICLSRLCSIPEQGKAYFTRYSCIYTMYYCLSSFNFTHNCISPSDRLLNSLSSLQYSCEALSSLCWKMQQFYLKKKNNGDENLAYQIFILYILDII